MEMPAPDAAQTGALCATSDNIILPCVFSSELMICQEKTVA